MTIDATPFNHQAAQSYETLSGVKCIAEHFPQLLAEYKAARAAGSLWHGPHEMWFQEDGELWGHFIAHAKDRKCLEVGCGPFGYLAFCHWIKDRAIIEPLLDIYRAEQIRVTGETIFTPDIKGYPQTAELVIEELVGKVNGFIVCRNCLDHCADPLKILRNFSEYAPAGAYLLFWSDLWHLKGCDEGHRNITQEIPLFRRTLNSLGFDILKVCQPIRDPAEYIEFGCLAVKR